MIVPKTRAATKVMAPRLRLRSGQSFKTDKLSNLAGDEESELQEVERPCPELPVVELHQLVEKLDEKITLLLTSIVCQCSAMT